MADEISNDRGALETDDFDKAFETAVATEETGNLTGEEITAAATPTVVAEENPAVEPVAAVVEAETPAVKAEPVAEEEEVKEEKRSKTIEGILKHERDVWKEEKAQLLKDLEEAKKPKTPEKPEPTAAEVKAAEAFVDSLTDEQRAQLEQYEQDFDVVSKMEGIKRGVELAKLRKEMADWKAEIKNEFVQHRDQITSKIAPVESYMEENEQETHLGMIRNGYVLEDGTEVSGHSDFEKFVNDGTLMAWIEAKPKYLQPALKETYEKGTAIDVIDMISDFKKENNLLTPEPVADNVIPIDQTKKAQKKQALAAVNSRPSAVAVAKVEINDFDSAFEQASK